MSHKGANLRKMTSSHCFSYSLPLLLWPKKMIKRLRVGGRSVSQGVSEGMKYAFKKGSRQSKELRNKNWIQSDTSSPFEQKLQNLEHKYALRTCNQHIQLQIWLYKKVKLFFAKHNAMLIQAKEKHFNPPLPLNLELLKAQGTKFNLLILLWMLTKNKQELNRNELYREPANICMRKCNI